ncbi:MAG TPA: transporter substrate-binding domain-containing protein [Woeseiaceae bacterium]
MTAWLVLVLVFQAGVSAADGADAAEPCQLHVAWDPYEPYSYSDDEKGPPKGYDIEVVSQVASMIGCTLSFEELSWSDILVAVREGRADVTIGTGYKPDRAVGSYFSESYRKEVIGLVVRAGTASTFAGDNLHDVLQRGLKFGKTTDDAYDDAIMQALEQYPDQVLEPVSEADNLDRLLARSIDGFLIEVNVGAALMRRAGVSDQVEFHPLAFDAGDYRLQMSKKTVSAQRVTEINAAIQELAASGWLDRTIQAYGM